MTRNPKTINQAIQNVVGAYSINQLLTAVDKLRVLVCRKRKVRRRKIIKARKSPKGGWRCWLSCGHTKFIGSKKSKTVRCPKCEAADQRLARMWMK